ncbi:hypothetical protein DPMN_037932 [Dreissena polymorpha]|uniref:UTP23 sensor motif region domain-containing protein n=1 Tax=Dreissena polymorpha TaxID=45954 RepID=A0A9D4RMR2_DREPO|nr:hypothetical protein DPMN_037932 [Dreissena polymorpha]
MKHFQKIFVSWILQTIHTPTPNPLSMKKSQEIYLQPTLLQDILRRTQWRCWGFQLHGT